jgi:6-phosphogluconate dehydrogenase (decarboxylating)
MQIGMVGLGRMGANMVRRLIKRGHSCVVFDMSPKVVQDLVAEKPRFLFSGGFRKETGAGWSG